MNRHLTITEALSALTLLCLPAQPVLADDDDVPAELTIGGNVYGGGNAGNTGGNTRVTIYGGDLGRVFGGAAQANVGGNSCVDIDGEHASSYIVIDNVYGGNDIAGTIGASTTLTKTMPFTPAVNKPAVGTEGDDDYVPPTVLVDNTWSTFVRTSTRATDPEKIYIGQLYGGGNGDYDYTTDHAGQTAPDLSKTYLELLGGSIVNAFGGGNMATVTDEVVIHLDNPSTPVSNIYVKDGREVSPGTAGSADLLTEERFKRMGFNYKFTYPKSGEFQIGNLFGGNNKVDMAVRPEWSLMDGRVRNLYSGGNEGRMTSQEGLLMQIAEGSTLTVDNVYGGCRKADVRPLYRDTGTPVPKEAIKLDPNPYKIPDGFAARVRVLGGNVNNVYGGNDISGDVYGGNTVGIYTTIHGNVYGGGNGSYAYTDNKRLKDDLLWRDFYYDPSAIKGRQAGGDFTQTESVEALNTYRPNAEQVSIRIAGTAAKPTIVEGAIYVGGNSATLESYTSEGVPTAELKIGSYAIADKVFLGNNGENMVDASADGVLVKYAGGVDLADGTHIDDFSSLDLTQADIFSKYMEGCAMKIIPSITFDTYPREPVSYLPHTSLFGSFYCGGNVGSMLFNGKTTINFDHEIVIFDKVVGGCNNANVPVQTATVDGVAGTQLNARYEGGFLTPGSAGPTVGDDTPIADKLELNLSKLRIEPKRWIGTKDAQGNYTSYSLDAQGNRQLEWNTIAATEGSVSLFTEVANGTNTGTPNADDLKRRLQGGNIYGGCYSSGHIDGNVTLNISGTVIDRTKVFDRVTSGSDKMYVNAEKKDFVINESNSGVILDLQGMDPLGRALNVFGGGKGKETEVWGSTTVNLTRGYVFQIFGGSEDGAIGRGTWNADTRRYDYADTYDPRFSCTINMHSAASGAARTTGENVETSNMADVEFIYGGGFEGPVLGDTHVYLGNGRVFNSFAGSCNADIWGHTETYIGLALDANGAEVAGFPWVRDNTYGGNDLGGTVWNRADASFAHRLSPYMQAADMQAKMYGYSVPDGQDTGTTPALTAAAYTEYRSGRVENIFGGCYGDYDYASTGSYAAYNAGKPYMHDTFVNFRPVQRSGNSVSRVFGAGQGHAEGVNNDVAIDKMQDRSYVLIDIPNDDTNPFEATEVFGSGSWCGLGMRAALPPVKADAEGDADFALRCDTYQAEVSRDYSAVIDLFRGTIGNVYGGSFNEGLTRRTVVNVPSVSTITAANLFGGAYGADPLYPCDVYEAQVNYHSAAATVEGNIYGGNNMADRTLYGQVNVSAPVWQNRAKGYKATIYGGGFGVNSWSQYTEVNLLSGADVYEVYGGGEQGRVINVPSLLKWQKDVVSSDASLDLFMYGYPENGLSNMLARPAMLDGTSRFNTNVHIHEGAYVSNYAYGGGLGDSTVVSSGDVMGTTYIDLLGGRVKKDIYAAGTQGAVRDYYGVKAGFTDIEGNAVAGFTASANVYLKGGACRNVYGGGWAGAVGKHDGIERKTTVNGKEVTYYDYLPAPTTADIPGETHVTIGDTDGTSFVNGIPTVERNAYGGGEGGPVWGTTYITLNRGYIGYRYFSSQDGADTEADLKGYSDGGGYYQEKLHDETWDGDGTNRLIDSGNIFGGGYIDNSSVDASYVKMYGGHVRNALFGGGEIAAVGRGVIHASGPDNSIRTLHGIYKAGKTNLEMFDGHVHRNVFGGGRGYNNLGKGGRLYSDGYVFGQTEVHVHGGEIGTEEGIAQGHGNVFGGGDIGYVYSAYEIDGTLYKGKKSGTRYDEGDEGYYYKHNGTAFVDDAGNALGATAEKIMTEDCRVLIEPHCKATAAVTIDGTTYAKGDFIPTTQLNKLGNKNADKTIWDNIDPAGIVIHNAVFAGGNTSSGSSAVYANATTIFGNATASVNDVYHRDLISLGTNHIGGIYGDGNLTFVDGYRGLNITNYGTDYYSIDKEITIEQYRKLPPREAAYYELRYKCIKECTDDDGTTYRPKNDDDPNSRASTLTADDILLLFKDGKNSTGMIVDGKPNPEYWTENGVLPVYAGRPMNTIQRADFCGVFGSRMVMQGAQDRVPEIVDYTNYTINRVREVSLNKKLSVIAADAADKEKKLHGNYFGIYNIVNYLGALTSDVNFGDAGDGTDKGDCGTGDTRTTDNKTTDAYEPEYDGQTFFGWKRSHIKDRTRNNGNSHNKVALASGVYLELTTEKSTGTGLREKDWGYITGVVELDLINVQPGIGGGFVYAKNVHGKRTATGLTHLTVGTLNADAVSRRQYRYSTQDSEKDEWQSSGNFVHSTQTIIDDCYNVSGKYKGGDDAAMPAHYWYIKGFVYVYDQYISAYTGSPNAYSKSVDIPLTITAASHGTMKLLNVQPNKYAFKKNSETELDEGGKLIINDVTYVKNDPISYWDWYLLSAAERGLFEDRTYVVNEDCWIGDTKYAAGKVLNESSYNTLRDNHPTVQVLADDGVTKRTADFDFVFRSSNNLSHDTGYILTYRVNNPKEWNTWYTEQNDDAHDSETPREKNQTGGDGYDNGPTYRLKGDTGSLLGQRYYEESNVISKTVVDTYHYVTENHADAIPTNDEDDPGYDETKRQAEFQPAYVITERVSVEETTAGGTSTHHLNPGAIVSEDYRTAHSLTASSVPAYIATSTIQLNSTEYIYMNNKMSETEKQGYIDRTTAEMRELLPVEKISDTDLAAITKMEDLTSAQLSGLTYEQQKRLAQLITIRADIKANIVLAYYCTEPGLYGGNYYEAGKNYRGLEAWSSMSAADREQFAFNYDALDLLIDPSFKGTVGEKWQYDGWNTSTDKPFATRAEAETNPAQYSLERHVDYTASYEGDGPLTLDTAVPVIGQAEPKTTLTAGDELTRETYESIPNEQRHYTTIDVKEAGDYYVVNTSFQIGNSSYAVGTTISHDDYRGLNDADKPYVTKFGFTAAQANQKFYYCREPYTIRTDAYGTSVTAQSVTATKGEGTDAVNASVSGSYAAGTTVPTGLVIDETTYDALVTKNLQKDFSIHGIAPTETSTLYVSRESDIYDLSKEKIITVIYQYDYEETDTKGNVTPISERHIVNIHLQFKSGIPIVEDIKAPEIVLPGDNVSLREPNVTPGAYEVTGGGWELFENIDDAESHTNGIEYSPNFDPLYWYQDGYLVAYYAKTYLGKTYSNTVKLGVANYHDLKRVMDDKLNHYYIDNEQVKREPKIYINDYSAAGQNGLKLFSDLIDLTHGKPLDGHTPLQRTAADVTKKPMRGGKYLEFFLRADQSAPAAEPGSPDTWTPIADGDGECFSGTLHGDGYTVSGLAGSLFGHLCGDVYNLGVTGTFTSAGIADTGEGYMENCWIASTAATGPAADTKPLFGNPSREGDNAVQMVNCYYLEDDDAAAKYTPHSGTHGTATRMTAQAFYNGQVAYNLNGHYLNRRYDMATGLTTTDPRHGNQQYVADRLRYGDFIYAAGTIPETAEPRLLTDADGNPVTDAEGYPSYAPIWPDDYIFFGQMLTYGHKDDRAHQPLPAHINKSGGLLTTRATAVNRVCRAPAYFRSAQMGVAHYNPGAVFAAQSADKTHSVYPGMTAIDFTGHDDIDWTRGAVSPVGGHANATTFFYPPLLDNDGLTGFTNADLTKNLLAYTPGPSDISEADTKTYSVVRTALSEPAYTETAPDTYRTVAEQSVGSIHGHHVVKTGTDDDGADIYTATSDHLLVDRQDFNAPISYTFDGSHRMYYQRTPDTYAAFGPAGTTQGWEGISLPFTAELVTTQQKGEITHFYRCGADPDKGSVGHEYWLRAFAGDVTPKKDDQGNAISGVYEAAFAYPTAAPGSNADKTVTNTFLWDYYYSWNTRRDLNSDTYQQYYQADDDGTVATYPAYAFAQGATPYIVAFPGADYYEFDLSGQFRPSTAASERPRLLERQVVTFASPTGTTIGVSDNERGTDGDGYAFRTNYLTQTFPAGTADTYTMNAEGTAYTLVPAASADPAAPVAPVTVEPFRPYFVKTAAGGRESRSIVFSDDDTTLTPHAGSNTGGSLNVSTRRHVIIVTSTLATAADVCITNTAGATVAAFTIAPGETVETRLHFTGIYIVNGKKYIVK